ncbi:hypothetical protein DFH06DRAFT_1226557 [Mycena polygramma]|nr:hypothetical protein DFH06DRAFT_1226557 [Mycena polygramma]
MSSPIGQESIDTSPSVLVPAHPFTNSPVADAILRSRDGADFHIVRAILCLLSPVFATMFSLPQPEATPEIPVVDMNEDAATLDKVLRFIYPGTHPVVETMDALRDIIELVVGKYDMQCEIPKAKQYLEKYCSSEYLAVYAVAAKYGWRDVAAAAAKESLKYPIRSLNTEPPPGLVGLTAVAYHHLLHYHFLCGQAARQTTMDLTWTDPPFIPGTCNCAQGRPFQFANESCRLPGWFSTYLTNMGRTLLDMPGVKPREIALFYIALKTTQCPCLGLDRFLLFVTLRWPARLEAEIAKVELQF